MKIRRRETLHSVILSRHAPSAMRRVNNICVHVDTWLPHHQRLTSKLSTRYAGVFQLLGNANGASLLQNIDAMCSRSSNLSLGQLALDQDLIGDEILGSLSRVDAFLEPCIEVRFVPVVPPQQACVVIVRDAVRLTVPGMEI